MGKFVLLLATFVGLATAGVLDPSWLQGPDRRTMSSIGDRIQINDPISRLSGEDLTRQGFLLRMLQHVDVRYGGIEWQNLPDAFVEHSESYKGGLDNDMTHLLELFKNGQLLGKHERYTVSNPAHLRQMIGLQHLLVHSKDWQTFAQNAFTARNHMNGVLFVNALLLAARERKDTRHLIVPGIHEILPELYIDSEILRTARNIDLNLLTTSTIHDTHRPNILEMIGFGAHMNRWGIGLLERRSGWNRMGVDRNRNLISTTEKVILHDNENQQNVEHSIKLLTEDVGLKGFLHQLMNEISLRGNEHRGRVRLDVDVNRGDGLGLLDRHMLSLDDHLHHLHDTCRRCIVDRHVLDCNQCIMMTSHDDLRQLGGDCLTCIQRQIDLDCNTCRDHLDRNQMGGIQREQSRGLNRWTDDTDLNSNWRQEELPPTSLNDDRLLHVSRRRLSMHGSVGNEHRNFRDQFLNVVHGQHQIDDGRKIKNIDDWHTWDRMRLKMQLGRDMETSELYGSCRKCIIERNIFDCNRCISVKRNDELIRLGRECQICIQRQTERECNICRGCIERDRMGGIGIDDHIRRVGGADQVLRHRMLNRNRLDLSSVEDLPSTTINDERLLLVNRCMLTDVNSSSRLANTRDRFLNVMRSGHAIDNGRKIKHKDEWGVIEMDMHNQITGICQKCIVERNVLDCNRCISQTTNDDLIRWGSECQSCIQRQIVMDCNICQERMERQRMGGIDHLQRGGIMRGIVLQRLSTDCKCCFERRTLADCRTCLMTSDIETLRSLPGDCLQCIHHRIDRDCNMCQNIIENELRGSDLQRGSNLWTVESNLNSNWRQDDLPTTSINNDRLLHVSRRRVSMMHGLTANENPNLRDRFLNVVHGQHAIDDGGKVKQHGDNWDTLNSGWDVMGHQMLSNVGLNSRMSDTCRKCIIERNRVVCNRCILNTRSDESMRLGSVCMSCIHRLRDVDCNICRHRLERRRIGVTENTRPQIQLHRLTNDCLSCLEHRTVSDCNVCLLRTNLETLHNLPRECLRCIHHRTDNDCDVCQSIVENTQPLDVKVESSNGILRGTHTNINSLQDLPKTSINDERLLHVNHRKLNALYETTDRRRNILSLDENEPIFDDGRRTKHTNDLNMLNRRDWHDEVSRGIGGIDSSQHLRQNVGNDVLERMGGICRKCINGRETSDCDKCLMVTTTVELNRLGDDCMSCIQRQNDMECIICSNHLQLRRIDVSDNNMQRGKVSHDDISLECKVCIDQRSEKDCHKCLMSMDKSDLNALPGKCIACVYRQEEIDCDICQNLLHLGNSIRLGELNTIQPGDINGRLNENCLQCLNTMTDSDCDRCLVTTSNVVLNRLEDVCIECIQRQNAGDCRICRIRLSIHNDQTHIRSDVDDDDERLLHVNRRRLNNEREDMWRTDDESIRSDVHREVDDDERRVLMNRRRLSDNDLWRTDDKRISHEINREVGDDEHRVFMNRRRLNEGDDVDEERLLHINRRRLNNDDDLVRGNMWRMHPISDSQRLMPRNDEPDDEPIDKSDILLHNLRQLLARINLERISLGLDSLETIISRNRIETDSSDVRQIKSGVVGGDITDLRQMLQSGLRIDGRHMTDIDVDREIAEILISRDNDDNILKILTTNMLKTAAQHHDEHLPTFQDIGIDLNDPSTLKLLRHLMLLVDDLRTKILGTYKIQDFSLISVKINDITVHKLVTRLEDRDIDLSNVRSEVKSKVLMLRQKQLTHNDFTIRIDVDSELNQRVVMRTLLGPKRRNDKMGRDLTLDERRAGFMLLDTHVVDLNFGRNIIERRSRDLRWTSRDTTPLTKIYERLYLAERGDGGDQTKSIDDITVGQNCRFPHRLLLPRGRVDGLDMELLVIITPFEGDRVTNDDDNDVVINCGMGVSTKGVDRHSLGFPLDRQLEGGLRADELLSLSNVRGVNVKIYHEGRLNSQKW